MTGFLEYMLSLLCRFIWFALPIPLNQNALRSILVLEKYICYN